MVDDGTSSAWKMYGMKGMEIAITHYKSIKRKQKMVNKR